MKTLYLILSLALFAGFFFFARCGDDENGNDIVLTAQQEQAKILNGTWTIQAATVPQGVNPAILDGGTMTFTIDHNYNPTTFSSTGVPDFFSTSDSSTWAFNGSTIDQINLFNVFPITSFTIDNLTGDSLSISFTYH